MADVRTTLAEAEAVPEAPPSPTHVAIRREDYRPPDWLVPEIRLDFDLGIERTRVRATLSVQRNGDHDRPLRLDGDGLAPLLVKVNDADADWRMDGPTLVIEQPGNRPTIFTEVEINPAANTKLMGLYALNGMLCTQCEAEGFRRITFFPDRPDVLSKYTVRMEGDAHAFPILLSNGNRVAAGESDNGRHWAQWEDPFPKPCYLFALVAGDLKANRDSFTTMTAERSISPSGSVRRICRRRNTRWSASSFPWTGTRRSTAATLLPGAMAEPTVASVLTLPHTFPCPARVWDGLSTSVAEASDPTFKAAVDSELLDPTMMLLLEEMLLAPPLNDNVPAVTVVVPE